MFCISSIDNIYKLSISSLNNFVIILYFYISFFMFIYLIDKDINSLRFLYR